MINCMLQCVITKQNMSCTKRRDTRATGDRKSAATEREETPQDVRQMG